MNPDESLNQELNSDPTDQSNDAPGGDRSPAEVANSATDALGADLWGAETAAAQPLVEMVPPATVASPASTPDAEGTAGVAVEADAIPPIVDAAVVVDSAEQLGTVTVSESDPISKDPPAVNFADQAAAVQARIDVLLQQEQQLKQSIADLQASYNRILSEQIADTQATLGRMVKEGLTELEQRRQTLQISIEQLERRQERIRAEMRTTFAGTSQDLAIRVQGFKDYLVGSLQDLVTAAEDLKLSAPPPPVEEAPRRSASREREESAPNPQFSDQSFENQSKQIRRLLDQYRTSPDYYGPSWQLRRTFEPIHAERVANWFFTQGGRGALRTMGSRLQNILIASATISILRKLYGDRVRTLVLADTPERLGEWRRGLQDCLGISRSDFGSDQGVVLFEAPEPLAQRADRLVKQKQLPLIIMDESEDVVNLSLLQFPLWLAFAADPTKPVMY